MQLNVNRAKKPTVPFVFIFDDNKMVTKPFSNILKRTGIRVHTANNRKRVNYLLNKHRYDAYCIDIKTDWSSTYGLGLVKKIKNKHPRAYVDVISGYPQYKNTSYENGADNFTLKPVQNINLYALRLKESIYRNHKTTAAKTDYENMSDFVFNTINILDSSPEIRSIMINILGQEIPQISLKLEEIQHLIGLSERFTSTANKIHDLGMSILERQNNG